MTAVPAPPTFVDLTPLTLAELNAMVDAINFSLNPPIARLRQTAGQAIANGTPTAITFDTEDEDSANGHSTSSNTSRYTAVYAGWYRVSGGASWAVNSTGNRAAYWYTNGTVVPGSETMGPSSASVFHSTTARSILVFLNVGNYVELYGYQTSTASLNTAASGQSESTMIVEFVSN